MDTTFTQRPGDDFRSGVTTTEVPNQSAVAWCAVFAGAVASAALSLILLFLGSGLGLTMISPWGNEGISATGFGVSSILGITIISFIASAVGGYIAGRLRTRWINTHSDEVFFRDTAHGFLSWSVATLGTAALLATVTGAIVSGGVDAGAKMAKGAMSSGGSSVHSHMLMMGADQGNSPAGSASTMQKDHLALPYMLDALLRKNPRENIPGDSAAGITAPESSAESADPRNLSDAAMAGTTTRSDRATQPQALKKAEVMRIYLNALASGELPETDVQYLAQSIAMSSSISQQAAEQRVRDTFATLQTRLQEAETSAREAADKARKASAATSLWLFISLLIGAFIASLMAVYGGRQRDL